MKHTITILSLLISICATAALPTLKEMEKIIGMQAWEEVDDYLQTQQWTYYSSENIGRKETELPLFNICWRQNGTLLSLITDGTPEQRPASVLYIITRDQDYRLFQKALAENGYELARTETDEQKTLFRYRSNNSMANIVERRNEKGELESRMVAVVAKGGPYDADNGVKYAFDSLGIKTQSYTWVDGKQDGVFTTYYPNGQPKFMLNYLDGVYSGAFEAYNEEGQRVIETTIQDGNAADTTTIWEYAGGEPVRELRGDFDVNFSTQERGAFSYAMRPTGMVSYTALNNGQQSIGYYRLTDGRGIHVEHDLMNHLLDSTELHLADGQLQRDGRHEAFLYQDSLLLHEEQIDYVNGQLEGDYRVVDYEIETPSGLIAIEQTGAYVANQKNGMFTHTQIRDGKHYIVQYTTFNLDLKQGSFMSREGAVVTVGNYSNNQLSGAIMYYVDSTLLGQPTVENYLSVGKLKLLETGTWALGQKTGTWHRMENGDSINTSYAMDLWKQTEYVFANNPSQRITYSKTADGMLCTIVDAADGHKIRETNYRVTDPKLIDQLNQGYKDSIRQDQLLHHGWDNTYTKDGKNYIFYYMEDGKEVYNDRYYPEQNLKVNTDPRRGHQYFWDTKSGEAYSGKVTLDTDDPQLMENAGIKDGLRNGTSVLIDRETKKKVSKEKYKNGIAEE